MKTIIKDGTIITENETRIADLLIEDSKVILIDSDLDDSDARIIDAKGKLVLPGGVDAHVHLDLPMFNTVSSDDHYTGGKAAAFGGTTSMIDFVSQGEGTLHENIERLRDKADPKVCIDYAFHMNITRFDENVAKEIEHLPEEGITSLKVFTAYNNRLRLNDENIFKVMEISRDTGIMTMLHAENGDEIERLIADALAKGHYEPYWHALTRPPSGAVEAGQRIIEISAKTDAPLYIVHMNAAGEVDNLTAARKRGLKVMGETCPQYLFFTEEELKRPDGAKWICSPPMRSKNDNQRLIEGVSQEEIQVIATDHCPFYYDGTTPILYEGKLIAIPGKELGSENFTKIPNGLPALGDRMPIFWSYGVGTG
ncbi:MAG: amidohydrolase family protein, partial [Anaerolineaceae bacterium]|nr:amidohydrolase family protein [Anaerolineaceae bacterium]